MHLSGAWDSWHRNHSSLSKMSLMTYTSIMHLTKVSHDAATLLNNKRPQFVVGNVVCLEQGSFMCRNYSLPDTQLLSKSNTFFPTQMLYYIVFLVKSLIFLWRSFLLFCFDKNEGLLFQLLSLEGSMGLTGQSICSHCPYLNLSASAQ